MSAHSSDTAQEAVARSEETLNKISSGIIEGAPKAQSSGGKASVFAAIAANIAVGIVKFIASAISGSAAMFSEGIHSIVDSGNGFLVLLGIKRSQKAPTIEHPFGFGKELYFWALVVAVSVFMLGGGASVMQGIESIQDVATGHAETGDATMSFIVLIAAMIIEGASWYVAFKQVNTARGNKSILRYIKDCKDPSMYTVLLEDTAAELGLIFALIGLGLSRITGNLYFDGAASILIGLLLMAVSVIMLKESKGLLLGEGMTKKELEEVRVLIEQEPEVQKVGRILTMYFGPDSLLITLDATFDPACSANQIMQAIDRIEKTIARNYPQTMRVFIEAENLADVERQREIQGSMAEE